MHTPGSLLTVGDLSRRTGIPIKAIRHYTDQGLVYTLGRSSAGYRTYNHDALQCLQMITTLRGLGLTVAEIGELARTQPRTLAPTLAGLLTASKQRVRARIAALQATLDRIDRFERDHHAELSSRQPLWAHDAECGCESA
jgi:MerR family copper efflux transcriptional regulator